MAAPESNLQPKGAPPAREPRRRRLIQLPTMIELGMQQITRNYSLLVVLGILVVSSFFRLAKVLTAKTLRFSRYPGVVQRRGAEGTAFYYESQLKRNAAASVGALMFIGAIWDLTTHPWTVFGSAIDLFVSAFSLIIATIAVKARPIEASQSTDLDWYVPSARDRLTASLGPGVTIAIGLWILFATLAGHNFGF